MDLLGPSISTARIYRDSGMTRAADHADAVVGGWSDAAYQFLLDFVGANRDENFMTERVRLLAEASGLALPPDNRAWGAVTSRAVRQGLIRRVGYAPAQTGHCRPMPVWRKATP